MNPEKVKEAVVNAYEHILTNEMFNALSCVKAAYLIEKYYKFDISVEVELSKAFLKKCRDYSYFKGSSMYPLPTTNTQHLRKRLCEDVLEHLKDNEIEITISEDASTMAIII